MDWAPLGLPLAHSEYDLQRVAVRLAVARPVIVALSTTPPDTKRSGRP